jgi:hypothetical protein
MELLNEDLLHVPNKEKGVNTHPVEEIIVSIPPLLLEKGIQVQILDHVSLEDHPVFFREGDRKIYQIINHKEEELIEK